MRVLRYLAVLVVLVPVLAGVARAADGDTPAADVERERASLKTAYRMATAPRPDASAIRDRLKATIADPAFPALTESERHAAKLLYGKVLHDLKDYTAARDALAEASQMPSAGFFDWRTRLSNSFRLGDFVDAARAATVIVETWPDKLTDISDEAILYIARNAAEDGAGDAITLQLVSGLHAAHWSPRDPFAESQYLWLIETRLRLARGDVAGARAAAANITDPDLVIDMRVDKRFDVIVQADPARFDIDRVMDARLESLRARAAAFPRRLAGVNALGQFLHQRGQDDAALAIFEGALARLKDSPAAFSDADQRNWTQDWRAAVLFALDRSDRAIAALAAGARANERGTANVSQAINLAGVYDDYDRPNDALAAVAALDAAHSSAYGRMALNNVRACALFQLGDKAALDPIVAYLKTHVKDGLRPFIDAMLCLGDQDAAAAAVIGALADPTARLSALDALQEYAPRPYLSPRQEATHAAWVALKNRPDVAAAIARVGRVESYRFLSPGA